MKNLRYRIVLLLLLCAALALATDLDTDSFTRADASTLGSEWTRVTDECGGNFDLGIFSNAVDVGPDVGSSRCAQRFNATQPASADYGAEIRITAIAGGGVNGVQAAGVRISSSANTGYWCGFNQQAEGNINRRIWKFVAGTYTSISSEAVAVAASDLIECRALGSTISMRVNGVEELSVTDTAITATGYGGIVLRHGTQDESRLDDFRLFDFAAVGGAAKRRVISQRIMERGISGTVAAVDPAGQWVDLAAPSAPYLIVESDDLPCSQARPGDVCATDVKLFSRSGGRRTTFLTWPVSNIGQPWRLPAPLGAACASVMRRDSWGVLFESLLGCVE